MPVRRLAFGGMRSDSLLGGLDSERIEQRTAGDCHGYESAQKDKGHGPVSQHSPDGVFKKTHCCVLHPVKGVFLLADVGSALEASI